MNGRSKLERELSALSDRYRATLRNLVAREETYVRQVIEAAEDLERQGLRETARAFRWLARDIRVQILKHQSLAPFLDQDLAAWAASLDQAARGLRRPA